MKKKSFMKKELEKNSMISTLLASDFQNNSDVYIKQHRIRRKKRERIFFNLNTIRILRKKISGKND